MAVMSDRVMPRVSLCADVTQLHTCMQAEAQSLIESPPSDPDAKSRMDLTHLEVITIDDASTVEVDDGLSIEWRQGDDDESAAVPRYWIHVADPTRWLDSGSPLDLEARRRCKTLYLPSGEHIELSTVCRLFEGELTTNEGHAGMKLACHPVWVELYQNAAAL